MSSRPPPIPPREFEVILPISPVNYEPITTFLSTRGSPIQSFDYITSSEASKYRYKPIWPRIFICLVMVLVVLGLGMLIFKHFQSSEATVVERREKGRMERMKMRKLNMTIDSSRYCSPGYTWFETTKQCYKATVVPTSYPDARAQCQSENGHLTSIHSLSESIFIAGLYHLEHHEYNRRNDQKTKYIYWIGLGMKMENGTDSELQWDDGSDLDFENWFRELDTVQTKGKRIAQGPTGILWFWTPLEVGGFVCKKDSENGTLEEDEKELIPIEPLQLDNERCPLGYYYLSETDTCYLVSTQNATYQDARKTCESTESNGDLVSIHSELENILLNGLIMMVLEDKGLLDSKAPFWIGLEAERRKFRWIDGSETDFFDGTRPSLLGHGRNLFFWSYWKCWEPTFSSDSKEMGYICKTGKVH